jgi:hypothetical protein
LRWRDHGLPAQGFDQKAQRGQRAHDEHGQAGEAAKRGVKLSVASTSSKVLYSLFGPVPQHLFNM